MKQQLKTTRNIYVKLPDNDAAPEPTLQKLTAAGLSLHNVSPAYVVGREIFPALTFMLESPAVEEQIITLRQTFEQQTGEVCLKGAPLKTMCFYTFCLGTMQEVAQQWQKAMAATSVQFGQVVECGLHQTSPNFCYLTACFHPLGDCRGYLEDLRRFERWRDQILCAVSLMRISHYHMVLTGLVQ